MKILAIDSSGLVAGVAVMEDDILIGEYTTNYKKTHSQTLLPMLDELKRMIELDMDSVDAIAVAAGPGSFTGLRIGSATAKGLGLALKKPLIGVPTVDALAMNLYGQTSLICPLMDARRNQVYTGIYTFEPVSACETAGAQTGACERASDGGNAAIQSGVCASVGGQPGTCADAAIQPGVCTPAGGQSGPCADAATQPGPGMDAANSPDQPGSLEQRFRLRVLEPQCVVPIETITEKLNALPQGTSVIFLGDGVPVFRTRLAELMKRPYSFAPATCNRQRAAAVALLAREYAAQGKLQSAAEHVPEYLRPSQAERQRAEAHGAASGENVKCPAPQAACSQENACGTVPEKDTVPARKEKEDV